MACFECDSTRFPFVLVRFVEERATDAEVRAVIETQREIMQRQERFVILVDAARATYSTSTQRRLYADWLRESEAAARRWCAGVAVVIVHPFMRAALQGVLWFFAPPVRIEVFGTIHAASARAAEWMREEGLANADAPLEIGS